MAKVLSCFLILVFCSICSLSLAQIQESSDNELVYAAVEDYVLALYQVEPERIKRSVDTSLYKIGYYDYDGNSYYDIPMSYQQLLDLSAKWNKSRNQVHEDTIHTITLYEVNSKIATAKLQAKWGIDYLHLSKNSDGQWKIMSIIWQSDSK